MVLYCVGRHVGLYDITTKQMTFLDIAIDSNTVTAIAHSSSSKYPNIIAFGQKPSKHQIPFVFIMCESKTPGKTGRKFYLKHEHIPNDPEAKINKIMLNKVKTQKDPTHKNTNK